jgi:hypothetical protein
VRERVEHRIDLCDTEAIGDKEVTKTLRNRRAGKEQGPVQARHQNMRRVPLWVVLLAVGVLADCDSCGPYCDCIAGEPSASGQQCTAPGYVCDCALSSDELEGSCVLACEKMGNTCFIRKPNEPWFTCAQQGPWIGQCVRSCQSSADCPAPCTCESNACAADGGVCG